MQVTDELIRDVVQEVLTAMRNGKTRPAGNGRFEARGGGDRRKAVDCIRRICTERAEELGREELEETRIGRLPHKIEKLTVIAERIPGVEWLKTEAYSGENGISLIEYAPFGVIGVITPVTHSLPT